MSINAAFADRVPGAPGAVTDTAEVSPLSPAAELERWYVQRRRWPVERDARGVLWLSAGTDFDVVEVPEEAGRDAPRRLIG